MAHRSGTRGAGRAVGLPRTEHGAARSGDARAQALERYSMLSGQPSNPNFARIWFSR